MRFFRAIAMILILALASSPALAAICATSCASQAMMTSMHANNDMAGMKNCHEGSMNKDKSTSSTEYKPCAMGAGCHFAQVTPPMDSSTKTVFFDSATVSFPKFVPSAKSIDLSPPLKPPA